jgi:hypothetical protein
MKPVTFPAPIHGMEAGTGSTGGAIPLRKCYGRSSWRRIWI